ncbi:hypothetical protein LP419_06345 [Massilia sp. H-1]|nr:hypothetical protein LP419_06345 [Massilia sp. H-1]
MLGTLNPAASDAFTRQAPSDSIRDALAASLRAGAHGARPCGTVTVALRSGAGRSFRRQAALAILLDNPSDAVGDTQERYVFRPAILRSFGWRVLDVPGRDWLADPDAVLQRIDTMLASGIDRALDVEIARPVVVPPPAPWRAVRERAGRAASGASRGRRAHAALRAGHVAQVLARQRAGHGTACDLRTDRQRLPEQRQAVRQRRTRCGR